MKTGQGNVCEAAFSGNDRWHVKLFVLIWAAASWIDSMASAATATLKKLRQRDELQAQVSWLLWAGLRLCQEHGLSTVASLHWIYMPLSLPTGSRADGSVKGKNILANGLLSQGPPCGHPQLVLPFALARSAAYSSVLRYLDVWASCTKKYWVTSSESDPLLTNSLQLFWWHQRKQLCQA